MTWVEHGRMLAMERGATRTVREGICCPAPTRASVIVDGVEHVVDFAAIQRF